MNNLKTNSILDESYSEYFGFTKEEVQDMLCYYGKKKNIRKFVIGMMDIDLVIQKFLIHGQ